MAKIRYFTHKSNRYILEHMGEKGSEWILMRIMDERMYRPNMEWLASNPRYSKLISMIKSGEFK